MKLANYCRRLRNASLEMRNCGQSAPPGSRAQLLAEVRKNIVCGQSFEKVCIGFAALIKLRITTLAPTWENCPYRKL